MADNDRREKMLERARNLLARAEHANTPDAERELCYDRYNKLVQEWAIEEAELESRRTAAERQTPILRVVKMEDSVLSAKWRTIVFEIARTFRCRSVSYAGTYDYGIVGFPSDVAFVEMLITSSFYTFVSTVQPRWEYELTFDHNCYRFKVAGYKWPDIAIIAMEHGSFIKGPNFGRGAYNGYHRYCKANKIEPTNHTQRNDAYRESFIDGFVRRLATRLEEMRSANAETSTALVLARGPAVDEEFYRNFPHLSPEERAKRQAAAEAEEERMAAEREKMLADMTPAQRAKFYAKEAAEEEKRAREDAAYWRKWEQSRSRRYDRKGLQAGAAAADKVNLLRASTVDKDADKAALNG